MQRKLRHHGATRRRNAGRGQAGCEYVGTNFALQPFATGSGQITGTLTDAASGLPIAGIGVEMWMLSGSSIVGITAASTNLSGVYTATGLLAGSYRVDTFGLPPTERSLRQRALSEQLLDDDHRRQHPGECLRRRHGHGEFRPLGRRRHLRRRDRFGDGHAASGRDSQPVSGGLEPVCGLLHHEPPRPVLHSRRAQRRLCGGHEQLAGLLRRDSQQHSLHLQLFGRDRGRVWHADHHQRRGSVCRTGPRRARRRHQLRARRPHAGPECAVQSAHRHRELHCHVHVDAASLTNAGAPQSYLLEAGFSPNTTAITLPIPGTGTTFAVPGVPPGTYYVRVKAVNPHGTSTASNEVMLVVGAGGVGLPDAPTNLSAFMAGDKITMTWTPAPGGGPANGYVVEAGSSSGSSNIATVNVTGASFTFSPVPNGFYFLRVRARNAAGVSLPSAEVMLIVGNVPAPPSPPTLSHTVSGSTVTLTWVAPVFGTATGTSSKRVRRPGCPTLPSRPLATC